MKTHVFINIIFIYKHSYAHKQDYPSWKPCNPVKKWFLGSSRDFLHQSRVSKDGYPEKRRVVEVLTLRGIGGLVLYVDRWDFQWSRRALEADGPGPPGCAHPLHYAGTPYFRSSATPAHVARRFSSNLEAFRAGRTL